MTSTKPVRRRWGRRLLWQAPLVGVAGMVAGFAPIGSTAVARAAGAQPEGLVCALGSTAPGVPLGKGGATVTPVTAGTHPSFVLTARDGYITTPDGNSTYMWGYSNGNDGFQYPGPVLCVNEGDTVTITLRNTLPADTSLVFPAVVDGKAFLNGKSNVVTADGTPESPDLTNNSLSKAALRNPLSQPNHGQLGGSVTYSFTASKPGTFLYESGTDPQLQVEMGLAGAIVVRPCTPAPSTAPAGTPCTPHWDHIYDDSVLTAGTVAAWSATSAYPAGTRVRSGGTVWQATAALAAAAPAPGTTGAQWASATDMADFSHFNPQHEYLHLLSEIDPDQHQAVENSHASVYDPAHVGGYAVGDQVTYHGVIFEATALVPAGSAPAMGASWAPLYNYAKYNARYWFINGRSFPDTIAANSAAHLPTQPYSALVHIQPLTPPVYSPEYNAKDVGSEWPAAVRFLNVGPVSYPFHPHADHDRQVGIDGDPQVNAIDQSDVSTDHFGLVVPPGETTEGLFSWYDAQHWSSQNNNIAVPVPDLASRAAGSYWSQSPYVGERFDPTTGSVQYNQCGEIYHVAHSHALFQATNYGFPGGGMLTMIRVDPPNSFPLNANCAEPWKQS